MGRILLTIPQNACWWVGDCIDIIMNVMDITLMVLTVHKGFRNLWQLLLFVYCMNNENIHNIIIITHTHHIIVQGHSTKYTIEYNTSSRYSMGQRASCLYDYCIKHEDSHATSLFYITMTPYQIMPRGYA